MGELAKPDPVGVPAAAKPRGGLVAGASKMLGKAKAGIGSALHAGGEAFEAGTEAAARLHRRLFLILLGLFGLLVLGAVFRSFGLLQLNYALIAVFGLGAIWLFLHPVHLAGMLLLGGGVAIADDLAGARAALAGYARLLGRVLLAFLIPLLFFALAPGDRALSASLPLLVLAPVAGLALWLFGKIDPRVEKAVLVGVPVGALLITAGNMLLPPRTLAALGVPAWLRADRPQDAELDKVELLIERRRNEERAAQLRAIREKLEKGQSLSAEDEALVGEARQDRTTLLKWLEQQSAAVQKRLGELGARRAAARPAAPAVPPPGTAPVPARGWSAAIAVPTGYRLCPAAGGYRTQCHPVGRPADIWYDSGSSICRTAPAVDRMRFRSRTGALDIAYRFVPLAQPCSTEGDAR